MRIGVASDVELGSHRAHAINVMKTAGGMARLGHEVCVLCREGEPSERAAAAYGEPALTWCCAPATAHLGERRQHEFGAWAREQALALDVDVLYARHFRAGLAGADAGLPTVIETHAYIGETKPAFVDMLAMSARGDASLAISTISQRLAAHYASRGARRLHVIPDGVDVELFTRPADLGRDPMAPWPRPRALYAGHLYDYKGVPTLIAAAAKLDAGVHLLGGSDEDIARVRGCCGETTMVHGRVDHAQVPRWLWHADVLVLPPSLTEPSCAWTSPVKLGEYLASGTPIVASRIPALEDWVDDSVVTWFEPDDASSLASSIQAVIEAGIDERRRTVAHDLARTFSYENRAGALLEAALGVPVRPAAPGGTRP